MSDPPFALVLRATRGAIRGHAPICLASPLTFDQYCCLDSAPSSFYCPFDTTYTMATEAPNSSWHPALMPDHETTTTTSVEPTRRPSPDASPDSLHNGTPLEPEPEPHSLDFTVDDSGAGDAWFSKDDADEGGARLASEQSAAQPANTTDTSTTTAQVGADPQQPNETSPSKPASQHASSMSFARTVSHEPSFGDDDEGDWSLPRTNTDPFKFMPPSDRTNSFPVVPPMASNNDAHDDQPLPSNQAWDVMEETEKAWDLHEQSQQTELAQEPSTQSDAAESQPSRSRHAPSRSMGGDIQAFQDQATERYEEGVPLIPNSNGPTHETPSSEQKSGPNPFANDDANEDENEDDFFSQINDSNADGSTIPPLERKSTSQVLGSFDEEPSTRQGAFDAVNEEDETAPSNAATSQAPPRAGGHRRTKTQELKANWKAVFDDDDDDDFLLEDSVVEDKTIDSTAFLGSDDEGLLDGPTDTTSAPQSVAGASPSSQPMARQASGSSRYTRQNAYQPAAPTYQPSQPLSSQPSYGSLYNSPAPTNSFTPAPQYGQPPPVSGTEQPKAQSFADKSKGGYASPFDLPSDIVSSVPKPRKRPSTQSLHTPGPASQAAPPGSARSASAGMSGPPPSNSRPPSSHGSQGPPSVSQKPSIPSLRNKSSFFEELPMAPKPRPTSRHSNRAPSPAQYPPQGPPTLGPSPLGPSTTTQTAPMSASPPNQTDPSPPPSSAGGLVAPERVSPYAALQSGAGPMPPPSSTASRYSPALGQPSGNAAPPPPAGNRYSPAPPAPRQSSYSPSRTSTTPPTLPHQPRTSSPLAHYETNSGKTYGEIALAERRSSSSSYEPRLGRVPSLPPTREVEEEDDHTGAGVSLGTRHSSAGSAHSASGPAPRQTPPPPSYAGQSTLSPPKRTGSNYAPQPLPTSQPGFVPPPRAQTQSPGASHGNKPATYGHARRPSSAHSAAPPEMTKPVQASYAPHTRPRGQSLTMNMVPPTDGREQDPLQRWKGVPILAWGVGGTIITSFPQSIPRYTMASSTPTISRAPGEVKVKNIKEIDPLPERLAKFPGPLKGKSKKKETVAWLASGIETLEKDLPDVSFHSELSHEVKRSIERLLLWKILRVFVEYDGVLEGSPAAEKAVREILSPDSAATTNDASFSAGLPMGSSGAPVTSMSSDAVDSGTMESIRINLMKGERENAVWTAVDKRLWGHAMLIAHTVSPGLYAQVTQEFVRKEVNYPGHSNEPMAALYKILSGNFEDCVDELVPSHARAGFQLMATDASTGPTRGAIDGLDKWRETLTLVLSNRNPDDVRGLNALGNLLAGYGRAEAAHICFMFSRSVSTFGGIDDPNASLVLLGSDHKQQASHFAKDTEALELSEVYEYGLALAGGNAASGGSPHLAAYKLQYALTLAEYGYRDKALQYCEAIATAMSSQTKRSPYHNGYLAGSVDNFMTRLKQAPKGESGSWISKPSMNKVSDSMWNKFNKFVSGDDDEGNGTGGPRNGENGPFNNIGTTPTISRSPSVNNFEMYGGGAPGYAAGTTPPIPVVNSKYAPAAAQPRAPSNSCEPTPQYAPAPAFVDTGYPGASTEPSYPGAAQSSPYAPVPSFQPIDNSTTASGYQPQGLQQSTSMPALSNIQGQDSTGQGYSPPSFGYEPSQMSTFTPDAEDNQNADEQGAGGYEPPSFQPYGYEPPSYEPDPEPSAEDGHVAPKPKKSFMDDDDDFAAPRSQEKTKTEKDRENDELVRKAAEEDGKRIPISLNLGHHVLIVTQRNALPKRRPPRRVGALAAGSPRNLRAPSRVRYPTKPTRPTLARPAASSTTRISSDGSTRSQAPRM